MELSSQEIIDALKKALPEAIPNRIDILIANDAIMNSMLPVLETFREDCQSHYKTNVLGTIFVQDYLPILVEYTNKKDSVHFSVAGQKAESFGRFPVAAYHS